MRIPPMKVAFDKEDIRDIHIKLDEILSTGMLAQGKYVAELEQQWAEYVRARHAIAVSSGTSAIEAPMHALGVAGKEVLVPDNTFAATAMSVMAAGGSVRLVDTDPATFSVSLDDLKKRLTPQTAGVIVVHIGGIVTPEIEAIRRWCDDQGIWLFEDCAHAHGSEHNGQRAGTFGIAGLILVLCDQGHDFRRGRNDRYQRRCYCRTVALAAQSRQASTLGQLSHSYRIKLANERVERHRRPGSTQTA